MMEFRFTKTRLLMLLLNVCVLGGSLVLVVFGGPTIPLILLTVGAIGMIVGKLSRARISSDETTAVVNNGVNN